MPFLAFTQNRSSRVLSTSRPNLVALEQFAPNSPFIVLTALTKTKTSFQAQISHKTKEKFSAASQKRMMYTHNAFGIYVHMDSQKNA